MKTKKETLKSVKKQLEEFRAKSKQIIDDLHYPARRKLLTINVIEPNGAFNGMTVAEMLTIVNLSNGTGERIVMEANGKAIEMWAEKRSRISVSFL